MAKFIEYYEFNLILLEKNIIKTNHLILYYYVNYII
jgi:hypothetical protein